MVCANCGRNISTESKFCRHCGHELKKIANDVNNRISDKIEAREEHHNIEDPGKKRRLFQGRLNRGNYLLGLMLSYIVLIGLSFIIGYIYGYITGKGLEENSLEYSLLLIAIYLPAAIVGLSLTVRRLHDTKNSGWALLLYLIPLVNLGVFLYLLFVKGTEGSNEYGAQPERGISFDAITGLK